MARRINKKCQHCATLDVESAIAVHGPEGDNCWNPGNVHGWGYDCHRRRTHYRHRDDANATRRRLRRSGIAPSKRAAVECLEVEPPEVTIAMAAVLVLYRQGADAPVHAVAAEVWQGDQKIAAVKPVHCMGMRGDRVSAYIKDLAKSLNQQFGVARFEDVIKSVPVHLCPLENCPLKV